MSQIAVADLTEAQAAHELEQLADALATHDLAYHQQDAPTISGASVGTVTEETGLTVGGTAIIALAVKGVMGLRPTIEAEIEGLDKPVGSSCIYYGRKGEILSGYQFCFDVNTDRLESKTSF